MALKPHKLTRPPCWHYWWQCNNNKKKKKNWLSMLSHPLKVQKLCQMVGHTRNGWNPTIKFKARLSLCFNWAPRHDGVLGSGGIAPRILDLGTRWRWVVSLAPRRFTSQVKSPWCPIGRRLGRPQSRFGYGGEEKNSQPLPGLEPSIIQPVAQLYTTDVFIYE
jgi:hypothetical protein